jgi:hypothetical protein
VYAVNIAISSVIRIMTVVLSDGSVFIIDKLPNTFEHEVGGCLDVLGISARLLCKVVLSVFRVVLVR